jgi:hypothetical protein
MPPNNTPNDSVNTPIAIAKDDASQPSLDELLELLKQRLKPLYNDVPGHPNPPVEQKMVWLLDETEYRKQKAKDNEALLVAQERRGQDGKDPKAFVRHSLLDKLDSMDLGKLAD